MPGYVPPPAAGANWTMNPAVRPPHAGAMMNRMPMPTRGPVCIDPPMYGQQPTAGLFQSVGPQGTYAVKFCAYLLHSGVMPHSCTAAFSTRHSCRYSYAGIFSAS